jgi:cytochrome c oxidase subunit 3
MIMTRWHSGCPGVEGTMSAHADAHHEGGYDHEYLEHPEDAEYGRATPGKIGMWLLLLGDAFSFFGLLLAYGIFRGQADVWRPEELPELGINFTAAMTFLLICSSVTMVLAHSACVEGDRTRTVRFLALTVLGGVLFLCGQVYEYWHLIDQGMFLRHPELHQTRYSSTFFFITSFHGLHVLTGVCYLTVMLVNAAKGKYDGGGDKAANSIEIAGLFWHFVDLVWILVFTFVYLVPE